MPWKALGRIAFLFLFSVPLSGCEVLGISLSDDPPADEGDQPFATPAACFSPGPVSGSSEGTAAVFLPDPISSSGNENIPPRSSTLGNYRYSVALNRLDGTGVLRGEHVDVRNGLACNERYGVQSSDNHFVFDYGEKGFQEAMTYYHADSYQEFLKELSVLQVPEPLRIVVHCGYENAFYFKDDTMDGVCLGDSLLTPGASYADDAMVSIHEVQHASTIYSYHPETSMNRFYYDEAGALNEALSDFMALLWTSDWVHPSLDPRRFSRWVLGLYFQGHDSSRGAHFCPAYSPGFPACGNYKLGARGFSADSNLVSYSYPDGMGWPLGNNFQGPGYLRNIFTEFSIQEEIHVTGISYVGALWDAFEAIKENYPGDTTVPKSLMTKLVHEAIGHLPQPNPLDRESPVTFVGYSNLLSQWASAVGMTSNDVSDLNSALENRGFKNPSQLQPGWAAIGPGFSTTPGLRFLDSREMLLSWLSDELAGHVENNISNSRLSPGDGGILWFDVQNNDVLTAGTVYLKVRITSGNAEFMSQIFNFGYVSETEAQILYSKVNGSGIVSQLSSANPEFHVPTGTSYFQTNIHYGDTYYTGLWIKVASDAVPGSTVDFEVSVEPANGPAETLTFQAVVQ